jgi:gliotoxin/aspirochlorine biosynthesis O-methyltransferase
MASNGVPNAEGALKQLISSLNESRAALTADTTRAYLDGILHNDTKLPDKSIGAMVSEAIDLLHQIEQLLEPGHLVLADHFLG